MSVVTKKSKCRILKLASMLAVTMGIIMAFYAFYIMSELYSFSATEQGKALYMAVKLLNIAFIAVIVEGVYFAIAGFYGMTNIGAVDAVNKIKVYGIVMTIAGVVDLIIVFVVTRYSITAGLTGTTICLHRLQIIELSFILMQMKCSMTEKAALEKNTHLIVFILWVNTTATGAHGLQKG